MTRIRLYTQSINPFTTKVELGLALKGLDYEREVSNDGEDIKRWSPVTHRLPVIHVGDRRIHDSSAILAALDDLFPEPPLLARDPKTARAQRRLAEWADSSLLFYWDRWRESRFPRPGDEQPAEDPTVLVKLRDGLARALGGGRPLTRRELREANVVNGLIGRLDDLVAFLGQRPFFYGEEPSLADVSVYGMLRIVYGGPIPGVDDELRARPVLIDYMRRMEARTAPGLPHPPLALPDATLPGPPSP